MYTNLRKPFCIRLLAAIIILFPGSTFRLQAQDTAFKRPPVTDNRKVFEAQVLHDSSKKMVELKSLVPDLVYDLRYAGTDNFMQRRMYPRKTNVTFLRLPAARALQQVQAALKPEGLGLKIFDAYRPYSVTVKFWELVKDERYVANPSKGSGHNRGVAVDLTLIDLATGRELDMGTGFDNFTDTAHAGFTALPENVLRNRRTLRNAMEQHGFTILDTEWWHFYLQPTARFEILDINFNDLKRISNR